MLQCAIPVRSCQRYLAIMQTMVEPDPLKIKYRETLIQAVVKGTAPTQSGHHRGTGTGERGNGRPSRVRGDAHGRVAAAA